MPTTNLAVRPASGRFSAFQMTVLVLLRVAIRWHFLYEGLIKLYTPNWTSAGYLDMSRWVLRPFFTWIVSNPPALAVVDFLNVWGLMLIGLALMLGLLTRLAAAMAAVLLLLYYCAYPPFAGLDFGSPSEGHYLIVNKNLIEVFALAAILIFPTSRSLGLDRLVHWLWRRREAAARSAEAGVCEPASRGTLARREVLASLATLPVLGGFVVAVAKAWGWKSFEEGNLAGREADAVSSATVKTFDFAGLKDLKAKVPHAKIGAVDLSRLILGGNLIGGWAHARDLIYVSKLVKAYHHRTKVFETFMLAERCGVNAVLTNPLLCGAIQEYWRRGLGRIQFISDCGGDDLLAMVRKSIDHGAAACYVQGGTADKLVRQKKIDEIGKAVDLIRRGGLPAGIGGHSIDTVKACVAHGLRPDFWMKTLHSNNYWSATPKPQCDNLWCENPAETIAFMADLPQPWIAFKTLAAGAIRPDMGFHYAFENGADFLCVGMYDFQLVDDVNTAVDILAGDLDRKRPWRA